MPCPNHTAAVPSVVGGAGSIAIALGGAALLGPVGVGVVVGAGVVAGAWALGNMVVDNWPAISAFASDAGAVIGDALGSAGRAVAGVVADPVGAVGDLGKVAGDALGKAGDFVKGLFG